MMIRRWRRRTPRPGPGPRRLSLPVAVGLALAIAPVARADQGGPSGVDAGLASEPLLPYVIGLLVAAITLAIVGVVVSVVNRRRPAQGPGGRTNALWTCASCGAGNAPGRSDCYACMAPRSAPAAAGARTAPRPADERSDRDPGRPDPRARDAAVTPGADAPPEP